MRISLGGSRENLISIFRTLANELEDGKQPEVYIPSNEGKSDLAIDTEVFTLEEESEVMYESYED